ncbi:hypothetical protein Zmor_007451 [Zophobas morio]|uniref:Uncharacterized protein n=1 Tax=Zophobas morio TaxID=2755281 RepID=A0AA38MPL9_9CUCU|nr:hypothetical protein Zmor_007451 [Zophobas morio]
MHNHITLTIPSSPQPTVSFPPYNPPPPRPPRSTCFDYSNAKHVGIDPPNTTSLLYIRAARRNARSCPEQGKLRAAGKECDPCVCIQVSLSELQSVQELRLPLLPPPQTSLKPIQNTDITNICILKAITQSKTPFCTEYHLRV